MAPGQISFKLTGSPSLNKVFRIELKTTSLISKYWDTELQTCICPSTTRSWYHYVDMGRTHT